MTPKYKNDCLEIVSEKNIVSKELVKEAIKKFKTNSF